MTALSFEPAGTQTFDELYAAHADRVRVYVRSRLGDVHLADDVVQETFLRVYRFQHRLDPNRPAWPWVKAIASNMCANAMRNKRITAESIVGDFESHPETAGLLVDLRDKDDPEQRALIAEDRRQLAGVLDGLAGSHRDVLVQKDLLGLTVSEIADRGGASPDSVKSLVVRARHAFRRAWDRAGNGRLAALLPWTRRWRDDRLTSPLVLVGVMPSAQGLVRLAGPIIAAGVLGIAGSAGTGRVPAPPVLPGLRTHLAAAASDVDLGVSGPRLPVERRATTGAPSPNAPLADRAVSVTVGGPTAAANGEVRREGSGGADGQIVVQDHLVLDPGPAAPGTGGYIVIDCDSEVRRLVCDAAEGVLPPASGS